MKITKTQLREIIREEILLIKEDQYIADEMESVLQKKKPKIGGWVFSVDQHSGSWEWNKGDATVYATLFWEGPQGLPIEVTHDGDHITDFSIKYKSSGDVKKDYNWYIKTMKKNLSMIEKKYIK